MSIPTENVGSLPRPARLQAAIAAYDAGTISFDDLAKEQDEACRDSIERMEATDAPIISDGEQRASSAGDGGELHPEGAPRVNRRLGKSLSRAAFAG